MRIIEHQHGQLSFSIGEAVRSERRAPRVVEVVGRCRKCGAPTTGTWRLCDEHFRRMVAEHNEAREPYAAAA